MIGFYGYGSGSATLVYCVRTCFVVHTTHFTCQFILFSPQKDVISSFLHVHSHPPNPQKLRAQLEANAVMTNMVSAVATQMLKPQHMLTKVIVLF